MSTDEIKSEAAEVFANHVGQHLLVFFVKRDGTLRRMTCIYGGAKPFGRNRTAISVFDTEIGETRAIYLPGVRKIRVLATRRHEKTYADAKREVDELFY